MRSRTGFSSAPPARRRHPAIRPEVNLVCLGCVFMSRVPIICHFLFLKLSVSYLHTCQLGLHVASPAGSHSTIRSKMNLVLINICMSHVSNVCHFLLLKLYLSCLYVLFFNFICVGVQMLRRVEDIPQFALSLIKLLLSVFLCLLRLNNVLLCIIKICTLLFLCCSICQ